MSRLTDGAAKDKHGAQRNGRPGAKAPKGHNLTDVGNGHRFAADHRDVARYVTGWKWTVWDGRRWRPDDTHAVELLAKQTVARMNQEALDALKVLAAATPDSHDDEGLKKAKAEAGRKLAWATRSEDARKQAAMLTMARSELAERVEKFDTHLWLFNADNGTIDLRTGRLRPHDRLDYLTQISPAAYRPDARCPAWEGFVSAVFGGDADLIRFVQRLAGYFLTGDTSEALLPIFHGAGANGKSTLVEVLLDVMGQCYGMKAPGDLLLARKSDPHPTERADLRGRRLVACVEVDEGRRLAEGLLKEMTGGDKLRARFMRMDFFEFDPTHKTILASNHLPRVRGTDYAIWRRLVVVPFGVRFWNPDEPAAPNEDRPGHLRADKGLRAKLLAERDGILAWMVRGCLDWQAHGLKRPRAVQDAGRAYRQDEDLVGRFVAERLDLSPEKSIGAGELYARFREWCEAAREVPASQTAFGRRLGEMGVTKQKISAVRYLGVGFKSAG